MKKKPIEFISPTKARTGVVTTMATSGQNKLNSNSKHQQTEKKIPSKTLATPLNST